MTHFISFRSEWLSDVAHVQGALKTMGASFKRFEIRLDPTLPDCVAEIESDEEIDIYRLRDLVNKQQDTHVICDTLAPLKISDNPMDRLYPVLEPYDHNS